MTKAKGVAALAAGAAFFGLLAAGATAQTFRTGSHATVAPGETVNSSLWMASRTLSIAGEVRGDLFCAAQTVTISGTISGDVICAAQTITVTGTVGGDMRVAAQTITSRAAITDNLTAAAQSFTQEQGGSVGGDASIAADSLTLGGSVGRDFGTAAGNVVISGNVGRNVKAGVQKIELSSGANVAGAVDYTSQADISVATGAAVGGKITKSLPEETPRRGYGSLWKIGLYVALALLVTALAVTALLPGTVHRAADQAVRSPLLALLLGFSASILVPVLVVLLLVSVVGIPLALLLFLAWLLAIGLSGIFSGYYLGRLLWRQQRHPLLIMLVGGAALLILYFVPFLGVLAFLAAIWLGTGMLLMSLQQTVSLPRYDTSRLVPSSPGKPAKR